MATMGPLTVSDELLAANLLIQVVKFEGQKGLIIYVYTGRQRNSVMIYSWPNRNIRQCGRNEWRHAISGASLRQQAGSTFDFPFSI